MTNKQPKFPHIMPPTKHHYAGIPPVVVILLSPFLLACALPAAEPDAVFVERFEGESGKRWSFDSTLEPPQLRWHTKGEKPGIHFRSVATDKYVKNHDYAWAAWDVGPRPFELQWEVELDRGLEQQWFLPGVAVALTSAPPGQLDSDDLVATISVHMAGIAASVCRGGFFNTPTEGHGAYSKITDEALWRPRGVGTGGAASVAWPMKHPSGAKLKFKIFRDHDNRLRFVVRWPDLPAGRGEPYWTGEYQLPADVADIPLRFISIKRMQTLSVHTSYRGFVMEGAVRSIQGRLLDVAPIPVAERFSQREPVLQDGAELALHGKHFRQNATVTVGGKPARNVRVESSEKLTCALPDLPSGRRHALSVANPEGLVADLDRGVPYGRLLEKAHPREASPAGGDVISITGAGFEKNTVLTVGGKPATIIEYVAPTEIKIRAPAGEAGPVEIEAHTGKHAFSGKPLFGYAPHPYLFFQAQDVPSLRRKFEQPMFHHYRRRVLDTANKLLARGPGDSHNASVGATFNLAFAYVFNNEEAYRDKLLEWVRKGWSQTRFDDFNLMSLAGMALAYDVLYSELSPEDRGTYQEYLDRGLDSYHKSSGAWFLGAGPNFSNTVPVGNSGGMLAGLAMMHSTPRAREVVDIAAQKARRYSDQCISPDGGCREGVQYWDFGGSFYLILAHALKHATGDDRGLLEHPHLKANVNFLSATLGGHGGQFAFNDTKQPWLGGYAVCADLGSRYNQPLMLWVADLCAEGGEKTRTRETWAPFAFLWRSEQSSPEEFPGVPTLTWLKDMQWGAMRSDRSFKPKLVIGFKGSRGPLTHHKQPDLGSYVLHANGEAYLVDPGYYEPKPTDHNLPLIDGQGPGVTGADIEDGWEAGPWRHITIDSTEGYGNSARRVRRLIVMHADDRVVVLDDIIPADDRPGEITTQFQTAWSPEIDAEATHPLIIKGQNGSLGARCFGHDLTLTARDRTFSSSWHWAKIDEQGPGDWHSVTADYQADPARPLVTVLQPAAGKAALSPPPRVKYNKAKIEVIFADELTIGFAQNKGGWQLIRP